jgi:hypothetical protein
VRKRREIEERGRYDSSMAALRVHHNEAGKHKLDAVRWGAVPLSSFLQRRRNFGS